MSELLDFATEISEQAAAIRALIDRETAPVVEKRPARVFPPKWEVGMRVRWIRSIDWGPARGCVGTIKTLRDPGRAGHEYQVFWVTPDGGTDSIFWTTPDDVEPLETPTEPTR